LGSQQEIAPRTAAWKLLCCGLMKAHSYSIPIGIAVIALGGSSWAGCGSSKGLRSSPKDSGVSDAVAGSGGQAGPASSQGGLAGTSGGLELGGTTTGGTDGLVDAGGVAGAGGTVGSGGAQGGSSAGADAARDVARPDGGGTDAKVVCGPVCAIDCQYGNVLDANGCATCSCNPPPIVDPACRCSAGTVQNASGCLTCGYCVYGYMLDASGCPTCTCKPTPACPGMKCAACSAGYINVRDADGCLTCTCAPGLDVPCTQIRDSILCAASGHCRWLAPGYCGLPPPVLEGCYDLATIGCVADKDCSDGQTCLAVGIMATGTGCPTCGVSCGDTLNICR
jgi:hypothetical protein